MVFGSVATLLPTTVMAEETDATTNFKVFTAYDLANAVNSGKSVNLTASINYDENGDAYLRVKPKSAAEKNQLALDFGEKVGKYGYIQVEYETNVIASSTVAQLISYHTAEYQYVNGTTRNLIFGAYNTYTSNTIYKTASTASDWFRWYKFCPWGDSQALTGYLDDDPYTVNPTLDEAYYDIKYIAFFYSQGDANGFDYDVYLESLPKATVTFLGKDGKTVSSEEYIEGMTVTLPEAPVVGGFKFLGWSADEGVTLVTEDFTATANITLKAIYEEIVEALVVMPKDMTAVGGGSEGATVTLIEDGGKSYWRFDPKNNQNKGATFDWTLNEEFAKDDYNYVKVGYKTNVATVTERGISFWITASNFSTQYVENTNWSYWPTQAYTTVTESDIVFNISEKKDAAANVTEFQYGRILPFNGQVATAIDGTDDLYFDIEYIAFFETKAEADEFDFDVYLESLPKFTVTFIGKDGKTVSFEEYIEGMTVTLPKAPAVGGFKFLGWSDGESEELITENFVATEDLTLTAVYESDCIIKTAADIAADGVLTSIIDNATTNSKLEAGKVEYKGLVDGMARFGVKDANVGADCTTNDRMLIAIDDVVFSEYPYAVLVYKTNIKSTALNFNMTTKDMVTEGDHKKFFGGSNTRVVDELATGVANFESTWAVEGKITGVYLPIFNGSATATMSADEYFDVQYVGFFRNKEEADAFDYAEYIANLPEFTVTFLGKDGEELQSVTYEGNKTVELPEAPEVEGYTFIGWKKNTDGEEGRLITASFMASENAIYEPVFAKNYTISLTASVGGQVEYNGVTATSHTINAYEGQILTFTAVPSAEDNIKLRNWHDLTSGQIVVLTDKYGIPYEDDSAPETISYTVKGNAVINANFVSAALVSRVRLVAFIGRGNQGYITVGGGNTPSTYFSEYMGGNTATTLKAVAYDGYTPAYWVRFTQDSLTQVLLATGDTLEAYPLGGSVYYQPVFVEKGKTKVLNVDKATREIISVEEIDGEAAVTVNYVDNSSAATSDKLLKVIGLNGTEVLSEKYPTYASEWIISTGNTNTKWTMSINGGEAFDISYEQTFNFNYMFPLNTGIVITEVALGEEEIKPDAVIKTLATWSANGITNFTGAFELGEGLELVQHGIMMSQNAEDLGNTVLKNNETGIIEVADGTIVGKVNATVTTSLYTVSKRLANEGDVWYGRAYLVYKKGETKYLVFAEDTIPMPAV